MKRTSLTTAVIAGIAGVAGIAGTANAVFINSDGLGEVLVYPYYTVNAGNSTLLSVVNTHNEGKAVKVRFLEAYDSREVLDFNLYLSPFDVWVAQVVNVGSGAGVFTNDNSCTVPPLGTTAGTASPFLTYAFDGELGDLAAPTDGGPTDVTRTLEGYIELIEMGVVVNTQEGTLAAITHHSGVPADCGQVVDAWDPTGGYWGGPGADENTDITSPTGGLFGSGTVLNHDAGQIFGYNADAIDQFYVPGTGGQQTNPQDLSPSISSGTSTTSYVFANGSLATTTYNVPIDAVSSLFTATSVMNEYVVAATIGASTEWVVNFPTKRFYVDPNYVGNTPERPFDVVFGSTGDATSCVPVTISYWNREEAAPGGSIGFSPRPVHGNSLCYEGQVVTFGQGTTPSKVLGSKLVTNIAVAYPTGWAQIGFVTNAQHAVTPDRAAPAAGENTFYGLPVTGFSVTNYVNGELTDSAGHIVLSNYSGLYRHKFNRLCTASGSTATTTACS